MPLLTPVETQLPAAALLANGRLEPVICSAIALGVLQETAGAGAVLTSFTLDLGTGAVPTEAVMLQSVVDKQTRSLAFVSMKAVEGDAVVLSASGVFLLPAG